MLHSGRPRIIIIITTTSAGTPHPIGAALIPIVQELGHELLGYILPEEVLRLCPRKGDQRRQVGGPREHGGGELPCHAQLQALVAPRHPCWARKVRLGAIKPPGIVLGQGTETEPGWGIDRAIACTDPSKA
jgi:hypothetical protein